MSFGFYEGYGGDDGVVWVFEVLVYVDDDDDDGLGVELLKIMFFEKKKGR